MTKQAIIDYVMHTLHNTNPAMLRGMLDELQTTERAHEEYEDLSELELVLADYTDYELTNCGHVTLVYPAGAFECEIIMHFDSETTVKFPESTRFDGGVPSFSGEESWKLNIRDGVVKAQKISG